MPSATIQTISDLIAIPDADRIEIAKVMGWQCVVKKGEFRIGDKAVYVEIDSLVPKKAEWAQFLEKDHYRIKTKRLRGALSQGLVLPITILNDSDKFQIGVDVSEVLGVTHYEKPVAAHIAGNIKRRFPSVVPKTDEIMLQSCLGVLDELHGQEVYVTVKCDGSSGTFVNHNGEKDVCSRNLSLKEQDGNVFWEVWKKYNLEKVLDNIGNFAIQGEVCGPGIQKNRLGLKEVDLFVFNIYDTDKQRLVDYQTMVSICEENNLKMVPVEKVFVLDKKVHTLDFFLELAKGKYPSGQRREGIVIRPTNPMFSPTLRGRMSFKALNNEYLLKDED